MKGFKGTPGPWKVYIGWNTDGVKSEEGEFICRTENFKSSASSLANAQLISKAPEMLALLQGITEEICTLLDDEDLTDDKLREFSESTLPNIHLQILTQIKQATEV